MQIHVMTLFPQSVEAVLGDSILKRAKERGYIDIQYHQIRDYTKNRQNQVDDYPYGGGRGCVMQIQPLYDCWKHICDVSGKRVHTVYLSPCGKVFTQEDAKRIQREYDSLILVCGHYEGIDERFIEECVDEEISLGDFVLTGGEIPAMAVADAVCRMVPGVLPDEECFTEESHFNGLLEYPQYSRPETWDGLKVPDVLLSGNQKNIDRWRRKQSLLRTRLKRPDMFLSFRPSSREDKELIAEIENELPADTEKTLPERISDYAERIVSKKESDRLVILAPAALSEFACLCTRKAYEAGYNDVSVLYKDSETAALRYRFSDEPYYDGSVQEKAMLLKADGTEVIELITEMPGMFEDVPIEKIRRFQLDMFGAERKLKDIPHFPVPTLFWAIKIFPDKTDTDALAALWDLIFTSGSFLPADPNVTALSVKDANGTDFSVSVSEADGIRYKTVPSTANGRIVMTKPVFVCGEILNGVSLLFEDGKVIETSAKTGTKVLKSLLKLHSRAQRVNEIILSDYAAFPDTFNALTDSKFASSIVIGDTRFIFGSDTVKITGCIKDGKHI